MLAYYLYPFVQNRDVREYTKVDLLQPEKVKELFDYCQILEAYITKKGWQFLIESYGYDKLYEIDKRSGWLSDQYIERIKYEISICKEE